MATPLYTPCSPPAPSYWICIIRNYLRIALIPESTGVWGTSETSTTIFQQIDLIIWSSHGGCSESNQVSHNHGRLVAGNTPQGQFTLTESRDCDELIVRGGNTVILDPSSLGIVQHGPIVSDIQARGLSLGALLPENRK